MRTKHLLAISILAFGLLGLAACGSGGPSASSGAGVGSNAAVASDEEEAGLEFAQCMREHGVEIEDPTPGQNITIENDDPRTRAALAACNGKLGDVGQELSPEEGNEFREGWLAFTQCMRDEGIDLADPKFQGSGKVLLGIAGIDTTSPAFKAAQKACQDKAPQTSGFGVGG